MESLNSLYLDAFFTTVQYQSFTKAAEALFISQSALSQRIKNLESELETTLILRDRAGLRLTLEGEELFQYCRSKKQLEQQFLGRVAKKKNIGLSGFIRLGGFSSVMRSAVFPCLAPLVKSNSNLRLRLVSREIYELKTLLRNGEIDFAITYENLKSDSYEGQKIAVETNTLVKAKNYKGDKVYIDHDENDETTKNILHKKSFKSHERNFLDDIYGVLAGVRAGLGLGVLPNHLLYGETSIVPVTPRRTMEIPVYLNFYKQPFYSELHRTVVDALKDGMAGHLDKHPKNLTT